MDKEYTVTCAWDGETLISQTPSSTSNLLSKRRNLGLHRQVRRLCNKQFVMEANTQLGHSPIISVGHGCITQVTDDTDWGAPCYCDSIPASA